MGIIGTDFSGLANSTTYYFKINGTEYNITTGTGVLPYPSYQDVANLIEAVVSPTFTCLLYGLNQYNEDIYIYDSSHLGFDSTVFLAVGTSGLDLFTHLIGWTGFNKAPVLPYSPQALTDTALVRNNYNSFIELGDPDVLPTGSASGVAINQSVTQIAVSHAVFPYLTIYSILAYTLSDVHFRADDNSINTISGNFVTAGFTTSQTINIISKTVTVPNVVATSVSSHKIIVSGTTLTTQEAAPTATIVTFIKLTDLDTLPTVTAKSVAYSSSGAYLAVTHQNGFIVYKWTGLTFNVVHTESFGTCYSCAFSHDENYLAIGSSVSPYLYIYSRSGDTFTLVSNPSITPPTGTVLSCAFPNVTSNYLIVGTNAAPYLIAYVKSGSVFNNLSNLTYSNATGVTGCAFSYDDSYLGITSASVRTIALYSFSNNVFNLVTIAPLAPPTAATSIAFSQNNKLVVAGDTSSPFIDVFFKNGNELFSEQHLNTNPASATQNCAIAFNNSYLVVVNTSSPYINIYSINTTTLNSLVSGGIALTEKAAITFIYTHVTGTAVLFGTVHGFTQVNVNYTASGTAHLSGSANFVIGPEFFYATSGTATFGSAAVTSRFTAFYIYAFAGGTARFSGAISFSFNGDTYVYVLINYRVILSGNIFGFTKVDITATVHSGTMRLTGSAITSNIRLYSYTPSGTAVLSGSAITSFFPTFAYTPSGTAVLSGSATTFHLVGIFYGDMYYGDGYYGD
jgi:hypothetical protein